MKPILLKWTDGARSEIGYAALCLLLAVPCQVAFYRRSSFAAQYGGGIPHVTESGDTALNNHGTITLVSRGVHAEASRREQTALLLVVLTLAGLFALDLTVSLRRRNAPGGEATREMQSAALSKWRLALFAIRGIAYAGPGTALVILFALPTDISVVLRLLVRLAMIHSVAAVLFCWLYSRWYVSLAERLKRDPDEAHRSNQYEWVCRRFGHPDPIAACERASIVWRRSVYWAMVEGAVAGFVFLVYFC